MIGICTRRKSEQFELMTKVLNDKLRQVKQKNIVETRRFSEMLERSILEL